MMPPKKHPKEARKSPRKAPQQADIAAPSAATAVPQPPAAGRSNLLPASVPSSSAPGAPELKRPRAEAKPQAREQHADSDKGRQSAAHRPSLRKSHTNNKNNKGLDALSAATLEPYVLRSKIIAPDVSGCRCLTINDTEDELLVAREDGSLVLYQLQYFQNIPHFILLRHTGGRMRRTITSLHYLHLTGPAAHADAPGNGRNRYFLASYLSGQLVVYDSTTLFPVSVYQRTGGAVWGCCVDGRRVLAALADGSWHELHIRFPRNTAVPQLTLSRIIPGITGADRALSVCCSSALQLAVGTDDAGNVHAWRLPADAVDDGGDEEPSAAAGRGGLSAHEALWNCRLPKGIALCCTVADGARPVVAVGTSMGDVVLIDAAHGHVFKTFSQHKGPVSTVASLGGVLYATGWHESLRSYRCDADGEWYPAEVKRRTHYHEAMQLLLLPKRQLLLSAARDGTIMYAPIAAVFTAPALYLNVTTQQFAFAKEKNVLLHTRLDRIEAFCMDAARRHWVPLFAHKVFGRFRVNRLWCDDSLRHIVFSTDERVVVAKVSWRTGGEEALAVSRLDEVVELVAGEGVLDARFVAAPPQSPGPTRLYLLKDDEVIFVSLTAGYPVVHTAIPSATATLPVVRGGVRPITLIYNATKQALQVFGLRGVSTCTLSDDGTPEVDSWLTNTTEAFTLVRQVPQLKATTPQPQKSAEPSVVIGLSTTSDRFVQHAGSATPALLPKTLPHDTVFVAQLPSASGDAGALSRYAFVSYFTRGLLLVGSEDWRMAARVSVEAAFVLKGDQQVLVLERNVEKTLEALPLAWKVRRFGN